MAYHMMSSCNYCGGKNNETTRIRQTENSYVSEAETKCADCGKTDYWAYGFFESSTDIVGKAATYGETTRKLAKAHRDDLNKKLLNKELT